MKCTCWTCLFCPCNNILTLGRRVKIHFCSEVPYCFLAANLTSDETETNRYFKQCTQVQNEILLLPVNGRLGVLSIRHCKFLQRWNNCQEKNDSVPSFHQIINQFYESSTVPKCVQTKTLETQCNTTPFLENKKYESPCHDHQVFDVALPPVA